MSASIDIRQLNAQIEAETHFITDLTEGMNRTIVGQSHLVNALLIGLLSDGHILPEGVPGLAKTLAIKTRPRSLMPNLDACSLRPICSRPTLSVRSFIARKRKNSA